MSKKVLKECFLLHISSLRPVIIGYPLKCTDVPVVRLQLGQFFLLLFKIPYSSLNPESKPHSLNPPLVYSSLIQREVFKYIPRWGKWVLRRRLGNNQATWHSTTLSNRRPEMAAILDPLPVYFSQHIRDIRPVLAQYRTSAGKHWSDIGPALAIDAEPSSDRCLMQPGAIVGHASLGLAPRMAALILANHC